MEPSYRDALRRTAGANGNGARRPKGNLRLSDELEATDRALARADEAATHAAMDSVRWERRGLLQRLTRRPR
jgi:hypothetical protein